jgi:ribosomal protein S18 acetylase RimI-like enzyme
MFLMIVRPLGFMLCFMNIRDYRDNDLAALTNLHSVSKQVAEKGIILDDDLAIFTPKYYIDKWQIWSQSDENHIRLAFDGDKLIGFVNFGKVKTRPAFDKGIVPKFGGEIYALYVHPDHFSKGVGQALFKDACAILSTQKINSMILWAMKKNKRACAFYDKMGGERVGKQKIEIGQRSWAEESCFAWKDVRSLVNL